MPEVAVLTRVRHGCGQELRSRLRALRPTDSHPNPFAGLSQGTHFARFVVLDIGAPHLLFTSRFDGSERSYLTALAGVEAACAIWELCVEPDPVNPGTLGDYLLHGGAARVPASYVMSALKPEHTVARVNAAIRLRDELAAFAEQAENLDADDLAQAFRALPSVCDMTEL